MSRSAAMPGQEIRRLAALDRYAILDTPPERSFDDITRLAAQFCDAPIGLISFVDGTRQFFKARIGSEGGTNSPLDVGFCPIVVRRAAPVVIPDTAADDVHATNLAVREGGVRFYAGVPLLTEDGQALGTLCVLDVRPRPDGLTPAQRDALQTLGREVMTLLELRRETAERRRTEARLRELNADLERKVTERVFERSRTWQVTPDMLVVINARGYFDAANPAWTAVLGWSEDELRRVPFADLVHPDDQLATEAVWRDAIDRGVPALRFENRYRHKDGSWRWLSWVGVPDDGRVYGRARDVTADREQAAALDQRTAELRLHRDIVQYDTSSILAFDRQYRVTAFNRAHDENVGRALGRRQLIGDVLPDLFPPDQAAAMKGLMDRALAGEAFSVVRQFGDPGLEMPTWEITYTPLQNADGEVVGAFHHARDVSERVRAERELTAVQGALRQSQKLEAVGQLTGGLAHDFNNLLTGIMGSLELLETRIGQGRLTDLDRYVGAAQSATKRAAALTHRLLAFSRRQTLDPKPMNVGGLVRGMEDLIRRTIGPAIELGIARADDLWPSLVDPSQLENALLNLCINARDAMPGGGRLTIEMANRVIDGRVSDIYELPPGQYATLCVSDTGTGMTAEVVAKAFDPFFTTKPLGQGTGLGLSMIYGFARQSGGQVRIHSEVGHGTNVCIYLPRYLGEVEEAGAPPDLVDAPRAGRGETVLVVDDEPTVRMLVTEVLEELGYAAIEAGDGASGLQVLQSDVRIDLLITDVGLPGGMNGRQMADAARVSRPTLRTLFITGYAETALVGDGHLAPGMHVLTKPFTLEALASRIRALIVGSGQEAGPA